MDETKIKAGVKLLENDFGGKAIPIEEKHELLRKQMTEEEVAEVYRRFKAKKEGTGSEKPVQDQLASRLRQTDGHFRPNSNGSSHGGSSVATTASISIISALGLTFLLDKYKDKKDKNLRDEIKDRVSCTLDDLRKKLNDLETNQNILKSQIVSKESIEAIIDEKIKKITEKQQISEVTSRALNLKVR